MEKFTRLDAYKLIKGIGNFFSSSALFTGKDIAKTEILTTSNASYNLLYSLADRKFTEKNIRYLDILDHNGIKIIQANHFVGKAEDVQKIGQGRFQDNWSNHKNTFNREMFVPIPDNFNFQLKKFYDILISVCWDLSSKADSQSFREQCSTIEKSNSNLELAFLETFAKNETRGEKLHFLLKEVPTTNLQVFAQIIFSSQNLAEALEKLQAATTFLPLYNLTKKEQSNQPTQCLLEILAQGPTRFLARMNNRGNVMQDLLVKIGKNYYINDNLPRAIASLRKAHIQSQIEPETQIPGCPFTRSLSQAKKIKTESEIQIVARKIILIAKQFLHKSVLVN